MPIVISIPPRIRRHLDRPSIPRLERLDKLVLLLSSVDGRVLRDSQALVVVDLLDARLARCRSRRCDAVDLEDLEPSLVVVAADYIEFLLVEKSQGWVREMKERKGPTVFVSYNFSFSRYAFSRFLTTGLIVSSCAVDVV